MSSRPSSPPPEDIIRLKDLEKRCPGAPRKKRRSRTVVGEESAVQRRYFRPVADFDMVHVVSGDGHVASRRMCRATTRPNVIDEPPNAERIRPLRLFTDDGNLSTRSTTSSRAAVSTGAADADKQGVSSSIARLTSIAIVDTSTPAGSTAATATVASASQDVGNKIR